MTKRELRWRFKDLPTAGEVADLVEQEVITREEARDLLFNAKKTHDIAEENNALREQIKFLQDTIDKLINKLATGRIYEFVNTYTPRYPTTYWLGVGKNSDYDMKFSANNVTLCSSSNIKDDTSLGAKVLN